MSASIDRALAVLRLVPPEPSSIDTTQLRLKLEEEGLGDVTPRTIQRTLEKLSTPYALRCDERVRPFRWSRLRNSPLIQIPALTEPLALSLQLAREHLSNALPRASLRHMEPYFRAAKHVLDSASSRAMAGWLSKVRVLPRGQPMHPPSVSGHVQDSVSAALLGDRQIRVAYRSRESQVLLHYAVHPLGLVLHGPIGYLVCLIEEHDDIRHLALHRIEQAEELETAARRPREFDLDTYVAVGAFGYEPGKLIQLCAAFDPYAARHLLECPLGKDQKAQELQDGRILITATVRETNELRWWLLGYGPRAEVKRPSKLRRWMVAEHRAALSTYLQSDE